MRPIPPLARRRLPAPVTAWLTLALGFLLAGPAVGSAKAAVREEFARWMNAGKAHLENRASARAIESFQAALRLDPGSGAAWRNLARAHLPLAQDAEALAALERARALDGESTATSYLTGLALAHLARFDRAVTNLEAAVRGDPFTVALRFQLAAALEKAGRTEAARAQFLETARLDPLHAPSHFRLGAIAAQAGDREGFERHHGDFVRSRQALGEEPRTPGSLERCRYTEAETAPGKPPEPAPAMPVRFADVTSAMFGDAPTGRAVAAAVLETGDRGAPTTFVVEASGEAGCLTLSADGRLVRSITVLPPGAAPGVVQCLAGDFHNPVPAGTRYDPELHAWTDVLLVGARGLTLLRRTGPTGFDDVTRAAGLDGVSARRAEWVDADHDGDLDLALATGAGPELWQNRGDGTFARVTPDVGLTGPPAVDLAAADWDNNLAIDLTVAGGERPSLVFMNRRAGRFALRADPPGPWPPARRIRADDLDNDGHLDALLVSDAGGILLFGGRGERRELAAPTLRDTVPVLVDMDNDGRLEVALAGGLAGQAEKGALRAWRGVDAGRWVEVSGKVGLESLDLPPIREVLAADFDADGDSDLLVVAHPGELRFLRNDGGNARRQIKLRLVGTKTNPVGLGTRVELRSGTFQVVRSIHALPIEIGIGAVEKLDSIRTTWANGVVDNQIDVVPPPGPLVVAEKNVAAGSCPYLYAWDGRRFRFVTDLLGNSPLGLSWRRDEVLAADPEEIVALGTANAFRPRGGAYEIEITEELREVLYLDTVRLLAVDHPPELEIHSTDKLGPPPFGPSELWALRAPRTLVRARGSDGIDRTEALRAIDGAFAPPGLALPPPWRGRCEPLEIELEFAEADPTRPLVMALTGWIQYGDASVNIAVSQNPALDSGAPVLEAERPGGVWQAVDVVVGMPAGKTKTILCDLDGKLPRDWTGRLRLTSGIELHWDRLAVLERSPLPEASRHESAPREATLRWRGFSDLRSRAPGHPPVPDYRRVSARPPWHTTPQGWCTRYGEVTELTRERDARLVLVNAGDALRIRFPARGLPRVPRGHVRSFFLYSVGWDKDADHNVVSGDTVEPLPVRAPGEWWREYNTRWVAGDRFAP